MSKSHKRPEQVSTDHNVGTLRPHFLTYARKIVEQRRLSCSHATPSDRTCVGDGDDLDVAS